jgi:hypothetical protein
MTSKKTRTAASRQDGKEFIAAVLKGSGSRPNDTANSTEKIQYAVRFADKAAESLARDLAPFMAGIHATTKRTAVAARGKKQLDVNFSTPNLGLALGISLKSVHLREGKGAARYTHNMKRNEEELRIEASGYHKRQPYAVMIGVLFLPADSCTDGKKDNPSSFGSWVRHLRPFCGRTSPKDDEDLFEKLYVALYDPAGTDIRFFDVETDPPRNAYPQATLEYGAFLQAVYHLYLARNSADFRWADGTEEPLDPVDGGD